MSNHDKPDIDAYRVAWANQSNAFRSALTNKLATIVDAYLMNFGECRRYNDHRHFAATITDAIVMYAIVEGWLDLTDMAVASDDEKDKMMNEFNRDAGLLSDARSDRINLRDQR